MKLKLQSGLTTVEFAIIGAVMKATRGQADGKAVTALLRERAAG